MNQDGVDNLSYKTIDELYEFYEITHSIQMGVYLRFNGDAQDPGELLTKESFLKLCTDGGQWTTAYNALFQYILKEYRLK